MFFQEYNEKTNLKRLTTGSCSGLVPEPARQVAQERAAEGGAAEARGRGLGRAPEPVRRRARPAGPAAGLGAGRGRGRGPGGPQRLAQPQHHLDLGEPPAGARAAALLGLAPAAGPADAHGDADAPAGARGHGAGQRAAPDAAAARRDGTARGEVR